MVKLHLNLSLLLSCKIQFLNLVVHCPQKNCFFSLLGWMTSVTKDKINRQCREDRKTLMSHLWLQVCLQNGSLNIQGAIQE